MAQNEAYRKAELKIDEAKKSGATEIHLGDENSTRSSQLTELPKSLEQLTQLKSLTVSHSRIATLPDWLEKLTHLEQLILAGIQLTELPDWLGNLTNLRTLDLGSNQLAILPKTLGQLKGLRMLNLCSNNLSEVPQSLGECKALLNLDLSFNRLSNLPESLGQLTELDTLNLYSNNFVSTPQSLNNVRRLTGVYFARSDRSEPGLRQLPTWIRSNRQLSVIQFSGEALRSLPEWIGELSSLVDLDLPANDLTDLPFSISKLKKLKSLNLAGNPLNPELSAANQEGLEAVRRYLRAKAEAQITLNEAKLILVGEGEVGKSSLLSALRDDPWVEGNPTTHGIEIKSIKVSTADKKTEITLNGWDFGGQRVYRPTHQLFFSAPAVYLVVWKPREGPQQGFVKEWISLIKHRTPDAKVIVVATHGGPKQRQPDIDRQQIWDLFGRDMVVDFFLIDSKPDKKGKRKGIVDLKKAIARIAASLPEMGRKVPKRWEETRQALKKTGAPYLPFRQVEKLCLDHNMDEDEAKDFVRISHRLGHLIHYEHDPLLQDIVALKPDWLSTAISFVLDDEQTRESHGLISFERLGELWSDPKRPKDRYSKELHPIFLGLMERYDLSYRIAVSHGNQTRGISLVAQLVPDVRPAEHELTCVWPHELLPGDVQQIQICRIVDAGTGQQATAEGLFYQLIVRLHKYSLGRVNYEESVHWQRGLVLVDDYGARALLEYAWNDVRITVRSPYPERFLAALTYEVKWLVENFWAGLRCDVMVPCIAPCGTKVAGTGLFEVEKLIESKRRNRPDYPCPVCSEWQNIEQLLHNAPTARPNPLEDLLANSAETLRILVDVRRQVSVGRTEVMGRFDKVDANSMELISKVEAAYAGVMQALTDDAKEGPRLFSFEPVDRRFFDRPKWISAKFRLTLWCEHARLPLPALSDKDDASGVYELNLPREWIVKSMPYLRLLTGLLSLVVPVAASATKLELDDTTYKGIEKQLELGQKTLESALKGGEKSEDWAAKGDTAPNLKQGDSIKAQGAVLRQLHAWLKEKDPGFGGLVRVQNRRQEFLWVHPKFESEY